MKGRARKTVIISLLLIQITFAFLAQAVSLQTSNTIIVDKNGNGQYTSVQEAINHASLGSTIYVKNGEYPEIVKIKKTIQLVGESKDSTLINPISEKNKYAIYIGAPNVKIKNLGITNGAPGLYPQGIKITSTNVEIYNCKLFDTPVGIGLWTGGNTISKSIFYNCNDEGIALLGSNKNPCNNNIISDCIFYDNCDAIELQHSSNNQILNCVIYDNTHTGIDAIASGNDENLISNCEIYNNRVNGIYFSGSSENRIIDCLIRDNQDGNIVMNKYSKNNEIIEDEEPQKVVETFSIKELIQNLLQRIDNFRNLSIFSF